MVAGHLTAYRLHLLIGCVIEFGVVLHQLLVLLFCLENSLEKRDGYRPIYWDHFQLFDHWFDHVVRTVSSIYMKVDSFKHKMSKEHIFVEFFALEGQLVVVESIFVNPRNGKTVLQGLI